MRKSIKFRQILFLIPILLLLILKNYSYYWDGVDYAWQVEKAPIQYLFHQHHLVYTPFMKLIYLGITDLGLNIRSIDLMIALNIIAGLFYLVICYRLLKCIFSDYKYAAPAGTLLIGLSYTFATYWRNVDAYIIPLALTSLIMYRITRNGIQNLNVELLDWLLLLLATIFHQISILVLPALVFAQYHSSSKNQKLRLLAIITVFFVSLSGLYLLTFHFMSPHLTHESFFKWVSGYAMGDYWIFKKVQGFPQIVCLSLKESLSSNKALFLAPIKGWVLLSNEYVIYGNFKIFNFLSWVLFIFMSGAIIAGAIGMFSNRKSGFLAKFLFIWIAPFIILFQVFTPSNNFYRMFYLLPFVIFLLTFVAGILKTSFDKISGIVFIIIFICFNFAFGFITESFPSSNQTLTYAKDVQELTSPRDLFIFSPSPDYQPRIYLNYFTDRDVFMIRHLPSRDRADLSDEQMKVVCNQSRKWLMDNYDNFYFSRGVVNYSDDYLEISTLDQNKKLPEMLVLHMSQIEIKEITEITSYPFNHADILEHK